MVKKEKVHMVDVPKWGEFKVRDFYKKVYSDDRFKDYLPEV